MINILHSKRYRTSSWLLFLFLLTLVFAASIGHMFQAPTSNEKLLERKSLLLADTNFEKVKKIDLKNRLGNFTFRYNDLNRNWEMSRPRELLIREDIIRKLLHEISMIKVKKVLKKDQINISNYSLDSPLFEISFSLDDSNDPIQLKFGLIDSIGNSTYVLVSKKNVIYQVDQIDNLFLKLDLPDFIETRVFVADRHEISSMMILSGDDLKKVGLQLSEIDGQWVGRVKKDLGQEKVIEFLDNFINIRSSMILDKLDKESEEDINKNFVHPLYRVSILKKDETEIVYDISSTFKKIGNLKIEKRQHFLVRSNLSPIIYVVPRKYLKVFAITEKNISSIPVKKLFY
ncbi:MAG: DUF4340 domain-containing protein [Halobacteriovoraceae bacterium]|nr:DUF4340 domain-containing protein [Halobacteriovoraceae bacterium]